MSAASMWTYAMSYSAIFSRKQINCIGNDYFTNVLSIDLADIVIVFSSLLESVLCLLESPHIVFAAANLLYKYKLNLLIFK